jgi:hypothetical protein
VSINFENIGAYVYIATVYRVSPPNPIVVTLRTTSSNINSVNTIDVEGLTPNTTYTCTVQAYGGKATITSPNVMQFTTPACWLNGPNIISPIPVTQTEANVSWTPATIINGGTTLTYTVTATGPYSNTSVSGISGTNYKFTGLEPSIGYVVHVVGNDDIGCNSPEGSLPFATSDMLVPSVTLTSSPCCSPGPTYYYTVSWAPVEGAISYNVDKYISFDPQTGQLYFDTRLQEGPVNCGQTVHYKVQANSAHHTTGWSNDLSVIIPTCPPPPGGRIAYSPAKTPSVTIGSEVSEITAYPNPASDLVTVAVPWIALDDTPVLLNDMFGNSLNASNLKRGEWKTDISTVGLSDGLYFMRVVTGGLINVTKVMVVHK